MTQPRYTVDFDGDRFLIETESGVLHLLTYAEARELRAQTLEDEDYRWTPDALLQYVQYAVSPAFDSMCPVARI